MIGKLIINGMKICLHKAIYTFKVFVYLRYYSLWNVRTKINIKLTTVCLENMWIFRREWDILNKHLSVKWIKCEFHLFEEFYINCLLNAKDLGINILII